MTTAPATASQSSFDFRPFGRMFWKEYRQQLCWRSTSKHPAKRAIGEGALK